MNLEPIGSHQIELEGVSHTATPSTKRRNAVGDITDSLHSSLPSTPNQHHLATHTGLHGNYYKMQKHTHFTRSPIFGIQAKKKFIKAVKVVLCLVKFFAIIFKKTKNQPKEAMSFTEIAQSLESDTMKFSGLSFDPRMYKAKREINLSNDVKNVLSVPSAYRSVEQLQTALYGLQTMKSFAEYPLHMQEKLVKVAWFESVPAKRVIIRQGHYAENFYFIISGSAVVTIMEENRETGESSLRTAAVLRKGSSFGELALLHRSKRTATVSSQGPVELLAIGRDDFFRIFMRGQKPGEEPEHIRFLRPLQFMKEWPLETLIEHPEMCLFHFYKRGQVIVKDSNSSDWIYIVKSGSCQVMKQLQAVKPKTQCIQKTKFSLPKIRNVLLSTSTSSSDETTENAKRMTLKFERGKMLHYSPRTTCSESDSSSMSAEDTRMHPDVFLTRSKTVDMSTNQFDSNNNLVRPTLDPLRGIRPSKVSYSKSNFHLNKKLTDNTGYNFYSGNQSKPCNSPSQKIGVVVYVQIETLMRKDVFGLSTIRQDPLHTQSSVSLVSKGAECVMINKDFFLKHATERVLRNIRSICSPYPSSRKLQKHLEHNAVWNEFKNEAVVSIVQDKKRMRKQTIIHK